MKSFTLVVSLDCVGIYEVEAESAEEAGDKFNSWDGDDQVVFSHYAEENTGEVLSVTED